MSFVITLTFMWVKQIFELCVCFFYLSFLQIVLDNKAHSGKVKIHLDNEASIKECKDPSVSGQGEKTEKRRDFLVVLQQ